MKKIFLFIGISLVIIALGYKANAQTDYFDFGSIVTYLPGSQCYGAGDAILPFSMNNGDILCFYRNASDYPMQYYNYTIIYSNLQNNTSPYPVFNNDRNGFPIGYMNEIFTYIVSIYQTPWRDQLLFARYNNIDDYIEFIGEKSWYPTSAFSDHWLMGLIEAPNNKFYLVSAWRYVDWSIPLEDLYISYSSDLMNTWSDWIGGGHINDEGDIHSASVVCDQNSNLYVCMNTTWGGKKIVLYVFDPILETFSTKINIATGFGGTIYLNQNTGKLAICYIREDKLTVRYSNVSDPSVWSLPIIIDSSLTNAIQGIGNTAIGGLYDFQNMFYLWNSKDEQYLFDWDGNETWKNKGIIPKSLNENYDTLNKVLSDQSGNAVIFQSYINANSERFVHVKRYSDSTNTVAEMPKYSEGIIQNYPNPFSNNTTLEFSNPNHSNYKLSVFNISGHKVFEKDDITTDKIEFEKGNLKPGVYFVELKGEKVFRGKIIIE